MIYVLLNFDSDFSLCGVSGMDDGVILSGRPFGGCAIIFRNSLLSRIQVVRTVARRYCTIKLQSGPTQERSNSLMKSRSCKEREEPDETSTLKSPPINRCAGCTSRVPCIDLLVKSLLANAILLVCVYLPTGYHTDASAADFSECLSELSGFIDSQLFDLLQESRS